MPSRGSPTPIGSTPVARTFRGMDKDTELRTALARSSRAHTAYTEMLGGRLPPGPGDSPRSDWERMKALQAEIEAADAEVARLRHERGEVPGWN